MRLTAGVRAWREREINVTASALIHSTQLVARIRSVSPCAVSVFDEIASRRKHAGPVTRAAIMTGLSGCHWGSTFSRRHSGNGVKDSTRKAMVATIASVSPPGLRS